jgi:GNAT superfamily N-acetyltransferase
VWRIARAEDDDAIVAMCAQYYYEDPGPRPVPPDQMRETLAVLRREPMRGRTVVLEIDGRAVGYSLLIAFWSNELGGEVCDVDEVFVAREHRGRGHGRALFDAIESRQLWPAPAVAIALGVTPGNARARRLYERIGFEAVGTSMVRRLSR